MQCLSLSKRCVVTPTSKPTGVSLRSPSCARVTGVREQLKPIHGTQNIHRNCIAKASSEGDKPKYEFGYTRKDVILLGGGLIGLGYAMYYGLQAMGMEPGIAGNWVQMVIFLGICVGWVSTYIYRVATKQMSYAQQLQQYEQAVMMKRLEEMTEEELKQVMTEVDEEKQGSTKAK